MEVEIDFRKTPQKNAEKYFEESKKARKKLDAAERAIKETVKKMEEVELKEQKKAEKPKKKARGKWFNKFHWCITSDDFLVIGGRDATQNEMIFKKHVEQGDIVLHADIKGAPLTVEVRREGCHARCVEGSGGDCCSIQLCLEAWPGFCGCLLG